MNNESSHISPNKKSWIFKRKIIDSYRTMHIRYSEFINNCIFWLIHPFEAKKSYKSIFLIYTMGKVASMSILDTLIRKLPHISTFAMHYMSSKNLQLQEEILNESIYKKMHSQHANRIKRYIKNHPNKEVKIITVIRDPLSQIVSNIFQQKSRFQMDTLKHLDIDNKQIDFEYHTNWLNEELFEFSGINILDKEFNKDQGFDIYKLKNISLLVLKFERINKVFNEAMFQFTGIHNWKIKRKNISDKKDYANDYQIFKKEILINENVFNAVYSSSFTTHFYEKEEIEVFKNNWLNNSF